MTTRTLPSVRDQLTDWTAGRPPKDGDEPQRETLDARDLKILGTIGRSTFATTKDGREIKLKGPVRPHRIEEAAPDALLVGKLVRRDDDGRPRTDTFLATPVEPGTYDRLAPRKRYVPKDRPPGPIDGLAELRRPADRLPVHLGNDAGDEKVVIMGALSKRPMLLMTDSRPVPMTVRRLIELVNADRGNLRHVNGHTLADWTHVRRWSALLIAAWPLVDAHLAGTPLRCAYEHDTAPVADTLDPVGVPVCNGHVGWADATPTDAA